MPHNNQKKLDTKDWFNKAFADVESAKILGESSGLYEPALYHCQQAAEKSLKGFLFWNDVAEFKNS